MHSRPVVSQALQVVPTPLFTHFTLLLLQRAQAMEDLMRGCSERRAPASGAARSGVCTGGNGRCCWVKTGKGGGC